jgi:hypothetical protein
VSAFTCDRADLAWALKAVIPHVLRERHFMPELEGIRIEVGAASRQMYLVATDRFTLGCARVDIAGDGIEPAGTSVHADDARDLLRRMRGKGSAELFIWEDGEVTADSRVRYPAAPGGADFPDWRALLGQVLRYPAGKPGMKFGYDAAYLARFAPAMEPGRALAVMPLKARTGAGAITAFLGEHFTGAVMARRLTAASDLDGKDMPDMPANLRRWRDLIPAPAPEKAGSAP